MVRTSGIFDSNFTSCQNHTPNTVSAQNPAGGEDIGSHVCTSGHGSHKNRPDSSGRYEVQATREGKTQLLWEVAVDILKIAWDVETEIAGAVA
jgi:hypothetical protein